MSNALRVKESFKHLARSAVHFVNNRRSSEELDYSLLLNSDCADEALPPALRTEIPQADIVERNLQAYRFHDWRTHFAKQLSGKGLEIGPLHRPMVRHAGMDIDYVDRYCVADLREHYPELNDLPLVEPDILDDAEELLTVSDGSYDFLISAHVIEHMKNPLRALEHWTRVVKPGGKIYLIVPDKREIFDRGRVRTTLEHIIFDYRSPSDERDYEHFLDYAVHVHGKRGDDAIAEADRLRDTDYSIHFHVFIPTDIIRLIEWFSENVRPLEILEGPVKSPKSDEFHLMLRVGSPQ